MAGTTTPFQWIIDNCVDVQVNHRAIVAHTLSRDQTVRASTRGGVIWRYVVTPSPGLVYSQVKDDLAALDAADRFTEETINFGNVASYIGTSLGTNISVMCIEMPDWKIIPYDRVEWTGTFTFIESKA